MKKRAFQKLIPAFFLAVLLSGAAALEVCAFPESFLRDRISPPEENTETVIIPVRRSRQSGVA